MKLNAIGRTLAASLLLATAVSANAEEPVAEAAEVEAKFSTNMPIEALMAHEGAAAVVEKHMPGISSHPAYDQFKGMSFQQVKPFSQGMITDEMLAKIDADLAALGTDDAVSDDTAA